MTKRIVLSALLCAATLTACQPNDRASNDDFDDVAAQADDPADGIGTSPSDPDPESLLLQVDGFTPLPCGVWVRAAYDAADAAALACAPADATFFVSGGVTCSDAVAFAAKRGGVARRLDYQLRALEASCP